MSPWGGDGRHVGVPLGALSDALCSSVRCRGRSLLCPTSFSSPCDAFVGGSGRLGGMSRFPDPWRAPHTQPACGTQGTYVVRPASSRGPAPARVHRLPWYKIALSTRSLLFPSSHALQQVGAWAARRADLRTRCPRRAPSAPRSHRVGLHVTPIARPSWPVQPHAGSPTRGSPAPAGAARPGARLAYASVAGAHLVKLGAWLSHPRPPL